MRTASVTIGMLLVGAAVALVNCGDDSPPPTGTGATGGSGGAGATGGSGGSKGGAAGSAGATGGSAGTGGSVDSGTPDSSATGGSSGAGGSAGKGGSAGSAGGGGKAGSSGAGGSSGAAGAAGGAGKDGGTGDSADASGDASSDAGMCPATQPASNTECAVEGDCKYGVTICTCVDPGPDGRWACAGDHDGGHGGEDSGANCPADDPTGTSCPDAGLPIGPCRYAGNTTCSCAVGDVDWNCIRFRPQTSDPMR